MKRCLLFCGLPIVGIPHHNYITCIAALKLRVEALERVTLEGLCEAIDGAWGDQVDAPCRRGVHNLAEAAYAYVQRCATP